MGERPQFLNAFTPEFLSSLTTSELFCLAKELTLSKEDNNFLQAVIQEMKRRK